MRPFYFIALVLAGVYVFHTCDNHEESTVNLQYIPMEMSASPEPEIAALTPKKIKIQKQTVQAAYHPVVLKRSPWSDKPPSDQLAISHPEVVIDFEAEAIPELMASNKSFD